MIVMLVIVIFLQVVQLCFSYRNHQELFRMNATSDSLAAEITGLQTDVAAETTVVGSAVTLIQGLASSLAAAIAAAGNQGATSDQLASLNALQTQINTDVSSLAAAVAANTPAAPAPAPAPTESTTSEALKATTSKKA
jgi:glutamine synthetase type III